MSEKRFSYNYLLEVEMIFDEKNDRGYYVNGENCTSDDVKALVDLLNEQQATIIKQDEEIKKLKRTERSWRRIHCCNKESDNCGIVIEQQSTVSRLEEENDNMNLFIKQTIEPLLSECVFELDTIESMSQVELAEKIEDEIIPFIQDFKYLKYESPEEEKQDKS